MAELEVALLVQILSFASLSSCVGISTRRTHGTVVGFPYLELGNGSEISSEYFSYAFSVSPMNSI